MAKIFFLSTSSGVFNQLRIEQPIRHCRSELGNTRLDTGGADALLRSLDRREHDCYVFGIMPSPQLVPIVEKLSTQARIIWQLDDLLTDLPPSNPVAACWTREHHEGLSYCLDLADKVVVTTATLREEMASETETVVAPNLIDLDAYQYRPRTGKRVLWCGSPSHFDDLRLIEDLPTSMPGWEFLFLGDLPQACRDYDFDPDGQTLAIRPKHANVRYVPFVRPYSRYLELINVEEAGCGLCPLVASRFNGCKSALKYFELAALGLPVVASDCEPYSSVIEHGRNGLLAGDWRHLIEETGPDLGRAGYENVRDHHSWQSYAKQPWIDLLMSLAS